MPAKLTNEDAVDLWFVGLDGEPQPLAAELEEISREGFEGHAYRRLPAKALPFELTGFCTCAAVDLTGVEEAVVALQGTLITYTDVRGRSFGPLACLSVRVLQTKNLLTATGAIDFSTGEAGIAHNRMIVFEFVLRQAG